MGGVAGFFDPAFALLAEAFGDLVAKGRERGGVAVVIDGKTVVEIWGGMADPGSNRPWRRETLACCFSVTKAVFSLLAHRLIDRGFLRLDAQVCDIWPEFGEAGKSAITVLDVLTHRAGLPAVSGQAMPGDLYDRIRMEHLLAASRPVVPARQAPVYHNMTYGYLLGAVLTRAAGGRPVERLLASELTGPLDADFRIGLTEDDQRRAAWMMQEDPSALIAGHRDENTLFDRSMRFFARDEDFNTQRWRSAVIGSGSGHATALGIARLFGVLAGENAVLSERRRCEAITQRAESTGADPILGVPIRYAEGFEMSAPPGLDFGPDPDTVGHWGAGGATGFADPARSVSFGYVTGLMASGMGSSARGRMLVERLYECL